jgi:putative FmdB family regulatory protein
MPIYEYYCNACGKTSAFLLLKVSEEIEPYCKECRSRDVTRVLSRVTVVRSEEKRMESLLNPAGLGGFDDNDPRSVERLMKRMGSALGDELGQDFQQEMEEIITTPESESNSEADL